MMTGRQCFPCTACCEGWLSADIQGHWMEPYTPCVHCTGKGCAIYEKRPVYPCVAFKCAWLTEHATVPDDMRPDKCGAIVALDRKWHGRKVITAFPTGERIPEDTLEWLMAYSRQHSIPLLFCENLLQEGKYTGKKSLGYGPPSFIHAVKTELEPEDIWKL